MNTDHLPPGPAGIEEAAGARAGARPRLARRRKRGGQRGNQNARKHGFYSGDLSRAEMNEFWRTITTGDVAPEIALLRIRLRVALQRNPGNQRVLDDASRILARWYSARFRLSRADRSFLREVIRGILVLVVLQNESNVP